MAADVQPIVVTFGLGVNARKRPADLDINECTIGENFDLDTQQSSMRSRLPFDLVATAPNAAAVRGFAQLIKQDGTISTLVQAGGTVFSWDGVSTFNSVGTVSTAAKLRGPREHNVTLDDKVLITDLSKEENVKTWDGMTFEDLAHDLSTTFKAKYCRVHKERAFFGNVTTGTTSVPHMLVGSKLSDVTDLSVDERPSAALDPSAPFFILTPDLKPINGLEYAFGNFLISSEVGRIHLLKGSSAFDFEIESFYDGSSAEGEECFHNIGNDVLIGGLGRIESLSGILEFGDVETNDLTLPISPLIEDVTAWRMFFDQTRQQVFCFPEGFSEVWVLHKSLVQPVNGQVTISPWSKWTTTVSDGFTPASAMSLRDPVTGTATVYMGGSTGQIYRLNGSGATDAGTDTITTTRTSKLINIPIHADVFDGRWWVDYRLQFETTITLSFMWGGVEYPDDELTFTIPSANFAIYNDSDHYGEEIFYSSRFQTRVRRQTQPMSGRGNYLQVKVSYSGEAEIEEVGIELRAQA